MNEVRIGSRGSPLALWQAEYAAALLRKAHPHLRVSIVVIKTSGDQDRKTPLVSMGGQGVFVKELEEALLANTIDVAVHSCKDVPHTIPDRLRIACCLPRENPMDALLSRHKSLEALPVGARIGTGSPRRVSQLLALRPDLKMEPLRGNLATRMDRIDQDLDGVVLAVAGLNRLGFQDRIAQIFSAEQMVPAVAQGAVVLEIRDDDSDIDGLISKIHHSETGFAVTLEREFMVQVGGGCKVPMAALARPLDAGWEFLAVLGDPARPGVVQRFRWTAHADEAMASMASWVAEVETVCRSLRIPLPRELPEHHLLHTWITPR